MVNKLARSQSLGVYTKFSMKRVKELTQLKKHLLWTHYIVAWDIYPRTPPRNSSRMALLLVYNLIPAPMQTSSVNPVSMLKPLENQFRKSGRANEQRTLVVRFIAMCGDQHQSNLKAENVTTSLSPMIKPGSPTFTFWPRKAMLLSPTRTMKRGALPNLMFVSKLCILTEEASTWGRNSYYI